MKRDMDLIRLILLEIEKQSDKKESFTLSVDGYRQKVVNNHCALLQDAGMIRGFTAGKDPLDPVSIGFGALTWDGHEFLDLVRSEGAWKQIKEKVKKSGNPLTILSIKSAAVNGPKKGNNGGRKEKDSSSVKQEILDAALKVFFEKGYGNTKMSDIALEAKISRGPLYYHFKNKRELFKSCLEMYHRENSRNIYDVLESDLEPVLKINAITDINIERMLKSNEASVTMDLMRYEELQDLNLRYSDYLKDVYDRIIKELEDGIDKGTVRDDIDPRTATTLITLVYEGMKNVISKVAYSKSAYGITREDIFEVSEMIGEKVKKFLKP